MQDNYSLFVYNPLLGPCLLTAFVLFVVCAAVVACPIYLWFWLRYEDAGKGQKYVDALTVGPLKWFAAQLCALPEKP